MFKYFKFLVIFQVGAGLALAAGTPPASPRGEREPQEKKRRVQATFVIADSVAEELHPVAREFFCAIVDDDHAFLINFFATTPLDVIKVLVGPIYRFPTANEPWPVLQVAAIKSDVQTVILLLTLAETHPELAPLIFTGTLSAGGPLYVAVLRERLEVIHALLSFFERQSPMLDSAYAIVAPSPTLGSAFYLAARRNRINAARAILSHIERSRDLARVLLSPDPLQGRDPFEVAAELGHFEIVRMILQAAQNTLFVQTIIVPRLLPPVLAEGDARLRFNALHMAALNHHVRVIELIGGSPFRLQFLRPANFLLPLPPGTIVGDEEQRRRRTTWHTLLMYYPELGGFEVNLLPADVAHMGRLEWAVYINSEEILRTQLQRNAILDRVLLLNMIRNQRPMFFTHTQQQHLEMIATLRAEFAANPAALETLTDIEAVWDEAGLNRFHNFRTQAAVYGVVGVLMIRQISGRLS